MERVVFEVIKLLVFLCCTLSCVLLVTNNFRILVDAEQTYVQKAIESFSEQLQAKYNKEKIFILPTLQNYLKRSV